MKHTRTGYPLICYRQAIIVLYCLFAPAAAFAQGEVVLHGRVTDEKDRPVAFASARIEEIGAGAYTNEKGAFSIPVPAAHRVKLLRPEIRGPGPLHRDKAGSRCGQIQNAPAPRSLAHPPLDAQRLV